MIEERAWLREAAFVRRQITERLSLPQTASFWTREQSIAFGQSYWSRVATIAATSPGTQEEAFVQLRAAHGGEIVVWLHLRTNDAGAIEGTLENLAPCMLADGARRSDLFFAAADLSFGFCFERGENDVHFRYWDEPANTSSH